MSFIPEKDMDSFGLAHPPPIRKLFASSNTEDDQTNVDNDTFKVFLRIKPKSELGHSNDCIRIDSAKLICKPPLSSKYKKMEKAEYTFSHIFGPKTPQTEIFSKCVVACVEDLLTERNSLIFTYGTTNAGKTFTVQGTERSPGIIPRSLYLLFSNINVHRKLHFKPYLAKDVFRVSSDASRDEIRIKNEILRSFQTSKVSKSVNYQDPNHIMQALQNTFVDLKVDKPTCSVWISFLEVYNEAIYDLLDSSTTSRKTLKMAADSDDNFYVKELKHVYVDNPEDAFTIYQYGKKNLNMASTKMNENSSRSHCIFTIHVINLDDETKPSVSKLCICDLAGTERLTKTQNTGIRLKESGNINGSLFQLNRCLRAIRENQTKRTNQLIPYRHSNLTKLLHSALDDRTEEKIIMIVNINPTAELYDETQQVLKMCAIASKIKNKPITQMFPRSSQFTSLIYGKERKENTAVDDGRDYSDELSDLEQEISKHSDDQADIQDLLEKLIQRDGEIDKMKKDLEFQKEMHETSKKNLQNYCNKVEENYKKRLAGLEERIKSQKKYYVWKIDDVKKNTILECTDDTIRSEMTEKNTRIEELESKLSELLSKNDSTNRKSARASLSNTAAVEELSMKDAKIEELEKIIVELEDTNLSLSEKINEKDSQIKEQESLILETKEAYLFLEQKYEAEVSKIADLEDELYGKTEVIDLLERKLEESEQKVESLEETLNKDTIEHEKILSAIEESRDNGFAEREKKIEELKEKIRVLKTEILPAQKSENEKTKKEIEELRSSKDKKITTLRKEMEDLKKEKILLRSDCDKELATSRKDIEDLKKENIVLQSDCGKELAKLRREIEELKLEPVVFVPKLKLPDEKKPETATLSRGVEELKNEAVELQPPTPRNEQSNDRKVMEPVVCVKKPIRYRELNLPDEKQSEMPTSRGKIEEIEDGKGELQRRTPKNERSNDRKVTEIEVGMKELQISDEEKLEIPPEYSIIPEISEEENTANRRYMTRFAKKTPKTPARKIPCDKENTPSTHPKSRKKRGNGKTPLGTSKLDDSSEANIFRNNCEKGKTPVRRQLPSEAVREIFTSDVSIPIFQAPEKIRLLHCSPSPEQHSFDFEPSSRDTSRRVEMTTPHQTVKMMMMKKKR